MLNIDWNLYDASIDPNEMYELFILKHVKGILEIMCPLRSNRQRKSSRLWMNAEIYRAIRNRKFYVSLFKLTRQNEHLQLSHVWRNLVNTMNDNAKSVYIQSQLDRNVKNPRRFWRIINNFLENSPTSLILLMMKLAQLLLKVKRQIF